VLVVDDEIIIREALRDTFELRGYRVTAVDDGQAALEALSSGRFDLVMLDLFMPKKEGLETLREIRTHYPSLLVYAISGGGAHHLDFLNIAREFGAHRVLHKPIEPDELFRFIAADHVGSAEMS
jgi:CheY-like chemotaxis protein